MIHYPSLSETSNAAATNISVVDVLACHPVSFPSSTQVRNIVASCYTYFPESLYFDHAKITSPVGSTDNTMPVPSMKRSDSVDRSPAVSQALPLLVALRNVIIPLVGTDGPNKKDPTQISFGPEAEEFISALQKFISCFLEAQSSHQDGIRIDVDRNGIVKNATDWVDYLEETDWLWEKTPPSSNLDEEYLLIKPMFFEIENEDRFLRRVRFTRPDEAITEPSQGSSKVLIPQLAPLEKVQKSVRKHVFNTMPIRLLCFEMNASKLSIALIERGDIYNYLVRKLQASFTDSQFRSDLQKEMDVARDIGAPLDKVEAEQKVIRIWVSRIARYAILSHTWLPVASGEVTYNAWKRGTFDAAQPGYHKLVNFCKVAAEAHGFSLGWMDTVCIDKESSAELDESIRSMYKWYDNAALCITHLSQTAKVETMHDDPWFTRGWTLQELLAPLRIKFYGEDWKQLVGYEYNDKKDDTIRREIEQATSITELELMSMTPDVSAISRKMQWAAERKVTRKEDIAYCLMGIFNVSISIAYGEGADQAFSRLMTEILRTSKDSVMDIFNWGGSNGSATSSLLPSSPRDYLDRSSDMLVLRRPIESLTLTHLGLRIPILLMPAIPSDRSTHQWKPIGDYYASVNIPYYKKYRYPRGYNLLDKKATGPKAWISSESNLHRIALGILNFWGDETSINVPETCLAVALACRQEATWLTPLGYESKLGTEKPIFFQLQNRHNANYQIKRSKLAKHGMHLLTMYL